MIPPIGSRGLPLTLVFHDSIDDTIADAANSRMALWDEAVWTPRATNAVGASGTVINPKGVVPSTTTFDKSSYPPTPTNLGMEQIPRAFGLRIATTAPRLNHARGHLLQGQTGQDIGASRHYPEQVKGTCGFGGLSITEAGQFTSHPTEGYTSARAGNHTWSQTSRSQTSQFDQMAGMPFVEGTFSSTESTWIGGPQVANIAHSVAGDIPSNGLGIIYGDKHNSQFQTTLVSSPILSTATTCGIAFTEDEHTFSSHWVINLRTDQPFVETGQDISMPDGLTGWSVMGQASARHANAAFSGEDTIQQILTHDAISNGTAPPQSKENTTLGRVDLGASVVVDSAGLIGYEGVIVASAFFAPTRDTDPTQIQGAISNDTTSKGYAGINIQVHSGMTARRNQTPLIDTGPEPYLYGTDGLVVMPMTDMVKTYAGRGIGHTVPASTNANNTWVRNFGRVRDDGSGLPSQAPAVGDTTAKPFGNGLIERKGAGRATKIVGSNACSVGSPESIDLEYSTGRWIADGVPTKVQVIPSIVGYTDVVVAAGAAKLAANPAAPNQTFRKPIVDYHVLVSVIDPNNVPAAVADTDPANTNIGQPTNRNAPMSNRLHIDANYQDIPCTIYHAIFRIDPTNLEQIFIESGAGVMAGLDATNFDCKASIIPRHSFTDGEYAQQGWGLHQATPFRPIALADSNTRIPKLCAAIEAGGFYQRGGISHLWDASIYEGELFVGADFIDSHDLCVATGTKDGHTTFGVFGNGQIWPDGTPSPQRPKGTELMVWRYSPTLDPLWTKDTTFASNPIKDMFPKSVVSVAYDTSCDTMTRASTDLLNISRTAIGIGAVWNLHDWVMPQIEMMRYLGREEKDAVVHPLSSQAASPPLPIYHPTLHCSSLRIMEDGRMAMAAVHIDYIKTENDYPAVDIKYPLNPDLDTGGCPAGYYQSGGKCIPLDGGQSDNPSGYGSDPASGDVVPEPTGAPSPVNGSGGSTPKSDNFSAYPTWSKLMANTQARSLILMFTDAEKDEQTGLAKRGRSLFDIQWETIPMGDGEVPNTIANQMWVDGDTWWSGARIAYWYAESGQQAIPITYGSYPDCRMTFAHLPRSLPFIENIIIGSNTVGTIRSGFPQIQPITTARTLSVALPFINANLGQPVSAWSVERIAFLTLTRFVATTIGFADFGSGANPHQELGWSGWSFPRGLYDPAAFGDNTLFFSDAPESTEAEPPIGGVIVPTEQGIFAGFGDIIDDNAGGANPYAPAFAYSLDCSAITYPVNLESFRAYKAGGTGEQLLNPPRTCGGLTEVLANIMDPAQSTYFALDQEYVNTGEPPFQIIGTSLVRTYNPFNPPTIEAQMLWTSITLGGTTIPFVFHGTEGHRLMRGGQGGWSHHGPLHYGISTKLHPYRVDRVFKQVHGGVGYNLPIHLLKPPAVHVRARAGGRNSLELEMETPFHRTDNIHLLGAATFNTGFELGGESPAGQARPVAGQYFLRTNLWDKPMWPTGGAKPAKTLGLGAYTRVHGPIVSGSYGLEAFWSDHPTDHFHAAAIPILPNTDYDLSMIQNSRYSPMMLGRIKEMSRHDMIAVSEQLMSSVDVHVSKSSRPMWDSGGIVSAQGIGYKDAVAGPYMIQTQSSMDGENLKGPATMAGGSGPQCLGHGQRIVRTPDGTLHQFQFHRSVQSGSLNLPQWCHLKKPIHADLFYNRRAMKPDQDAAVFGGKDECGPTLASVGAGMSQGEYHKGRVMGAAFCSDSNGTLHAVIEYHPNPNDVPSHQAHELYYHKAERTMSTYNPEPVYDWDWSVHTPVLIQSGLTGTTESGGTRWDLRQPSLVCDSQDKLHLAVVQVLSTVGGSGLPQSTRIFYTCKLDSEPSFADWVPLDSTARPDDNRWQLVHGSIPDAGYTTLNQASVGPHYTNFNAEPKVCLRGDNLPVVFYRGFPIQSFGIADRNYSAIYANIGISPNVLSNDPSGRYAFDTKRCYHVVGLPPDAKNTLEPYNVVYYDAIIDERDRALVVSCKDDRDTSLAKTFAPRQTLLTVFDTRKTLAEQYDAINGLGNHITVWRGPVYNGTSELKAVDPSYRDLTLSTDGKGNIHLVMTFSMIGEDDGRLGEVYRDAASPQVRQSALGPLQWAATPTGKLNVSGVETPYLGGFIKPNISPNWSGAVVPPYPPYMDSTTGREYQHILHCWIPSIEFDTTANVLRSINIRWLSVPSLRWDNANNTWSPVGSAQTMAGQEDFPHHSTQLRYQRFWGYDASEIDLRWFTNETSWYRTGHKGADLYYPSAGGVQMQMGDSQTKGEGIAGYPDGL